jgi:hypothetical protein
MKGFGASNTREECPNGEVRSGSCRSGEKRRMVKAALVHAALVRRDWHERDLKCRACRYLFDCGQECRAELSREPLHTPVFHSANGRSESALIWTKRCGGGEVPCRECHSAVRDPLGAALHAEQRPLALADPTTWRSEEFNKRSGRRAHEELEL